MAIFSQIQQNKYFTYFEKTGMKFNGLWKNRTNGEFIEFTGPQESDEYFLEYDEPENSFRSEKVQIFITNENHALLTYSEKFGRSDISILSPDSYEIRGNVFDRCSNREE